MVESLLAFAVVAGLLAIIPGIDFTMVLRYAMTTPKRVAFAAMAGIQAGVFIWGAASAVGLSALLTASETAFTALRIAGAVYLAYLGATLIWQARGGKSHQIETSTSAPTTALGAFWRGMLTNLLNPKVGVFYVAMLPSFIPAGSNHLVAGLALASVHVLEGALWLGAVILLTTRIKPWFESVRNRQIFDRIAGAIIIGFGLKLLATKH